MDEVGGIVGQHQAHSHTGGEEGSIPAVHRELVPAAAQMGGNGFVSFTSLSNHSESQVVGAERTNHHRHFAPTLWGCSRVPALNNFLLGQIIPDNTLQRLLE